MVHWYLSIRNLLRSLDQKARDAKALYIDSGKDATAAINRYMWADYEQLWQQWSARFPDENLGHLGRHIKFGMDCDYDDIVNHDLPDLEKRAEGHLLKSTDQAHGHEALGFEQLLHPVIEQHSYQLYKNGHLREAVLNSITAIFDYIRDRTGAADDGDRLVGRVFSLENPILILSELTTESGQSDQKGFMQIYKGAFLGIRNPKAHSLDHDLTPQKAAQYLVFASLLARRIEEAHVANA
jgi:uncharacterized protein (TIGR02391 family)